MHLKTIIKIIIKEKNMFIFKITFIKIKIKIISRTIKIIKLFFENKIKDINIKVKYKKIQIVNY